MPTRRRPRVERLFKTLQDRLVKDLRLAGIATVEAANQFVETWLPRYNRRFAVPPAQAAELHRPVLRACEGGRTDRWDGADDPPRPAAHLSGHCRAAPQGGGAGDTHAASTSRQAPSGSSMEWLRNSSLPIDRPQPKPNSGHFYCGRTRTFLKWVDISTLPSSRYIPSSLLCYEAHARLVCILGDRDLFGCGRLRSKPVLRIFSRIGIHDGVMGVSLALFDKVHTLRANFHAIDKHLGREWVRQALQGE
jgi:hypothetical protein